ncbi:hypothetical protein WSM22_36050 [Cytophagales bacterium WSM2-2]|nr:hypothetical protein WSM22_36050 [Cytophagales bacterium WSM2-2]
MAAFVIASGVFFCCGKSPRDKKVSTVPDSIRTNIISVPQGFGYEIYFKDKKIIHQPVIPGKAGNVPFSSREEASGIANLVGSKIRKGIMPPSVTAQEVDSVLNKNN